MTHSPVWTLCIKNENFLGTLRHFSETTLTSVAKSVFTFGNWLIMLLVTRNKTGTSSDKIGTSRYETGTAGTKQGQQGKNRNSMDKTGTVGIQQGQAGTKQGQPCTKHWKQKCVIVPLCPYFVPARFVPADLALLICPFLCLFCPCFAVACFVPVLSLPVLPLFFLNLSLLVPNLFFHQLGPSGPSWS